MAAFDLEIDRLAATAMPPVATPIQFKVLTLNTHKGFTSFNRRFVLHELRDAIRTVSADVVFLQEVLGDHSEHPSRFRNWPPTPQYEFLADTIWAHFSYGRNAVYPDGHHGNALLSKFPIVSYQNIDVSIAGPERRGLLHAVLRHPLDGREVHAVCTHLGLMEQHRQQQLQLLCDLVASLPSDAPLVIAGDFNDWRVRADRVLSGCAGLTEAFAQVHGKAARTFPARLPLLRLDRVYTRNLRVSNPEVHCERPWSHLSDHAALSVELEA
jgi:endonuclease/exonuclease/phosphatase family metal-dependent hydrolase